MITHDYLSTACHHDLHGRCRQVCKFCESVCECFCHNGKPSLAAKLRRILRGSPSSSQSLVD